MKRARSSLTRTVALLSTRMRTPSYLHTDAKKGGTIRNEYNVDIHTLPMEKHQHGDGCHQISQRTKENENDILDKVVH